MISIIVAMDDNRLIERRIHLMECHGTTKKI